MRFGIAGHILGILARSACGLSLIALAVGCGQPLEQESSAATLESGAAVTLPQSVGGAFWANPNVYETIPVDVAAAGASAVTVSVNGTHAEALESSPGLWTADVRIADFADGVYALVAQAMTPDGLVAAKAELAIGRQGQQMTDWNRTGRVGPPRMHRVGNEVYATWTDRREGGSEAWMQRIDGAGRWYGDVIRIGHSDHETLDARTAFGKESIGVLFQDLEGLPYVHRFQIVDRRGEILYGPIDLNPSGLYGVKGGDILFDGEAFVLVWRLSAGGGKGEVRWLRIDEASHAQTGPVTVATAGQNNTFLLNSPLTVATIGDMSMVGFLRKRWNSAAQFAVPRAHFADVRKNGSVVRETLASGSYDWNEEAWAFAVGNQFVPLWSSVDLRNSNPNPPTRFHANAVGSTESAGTGRIFVDAPQTRSEAFLIAHPDHFATVAWLDQRSKDAGPDSGKIQLYAGRLDGNLGLSWPVIFDHAWFVQGTSALTGLNAGRNTVLMWLDQRHGSGIFDPKPEIFLETVWQ